MNKLALLSVLWTMMGTNAVIWQPYKGSEYYIYNSTTKYTYYQAWHECQMLNATLATVKNGRIQKFLRKRMKKAGSVGGSTSFYIGLNRIDANSNRNSAFAWTDGTLLKDTRSFWNPGEPNLGSENCVIMELNTKSLWHDVKCFRRMHYICEKEVKAYPEKVWHEHNGTEYFVQSSANNVTTLSGANYFCLANGGKVAQVQTNETRDFLNELINELKYQDHIKEYYMGYTGTEVVVAGQNYSTYQYKLWDGRFLSNDVPNWGVNQSEIFNETMKYVAISDDYDNPWIRVDHQKTRLYICERNTTKMVQCSPSTATQTTVATTTTTTAASKQPTTTQQNKPAGSDKLQGDTVETGKLEPDNSLIASFPILLACLLLSLAVNGCFVWKQVREKGKTELNNTYTSMYHVQKKTEDITPSYSSQIDLVNL